MIQQLVILGLGIALFTVLQAYRRASRQPLPPGPPGHWLFGNKLPTINPYLQYEEWAKRFGPVYSLNHGAKIVIVVARYDAAVDIMEKEGANVADRPNQIAAGEIISGGMRTLLLSWGPKLKQFRKALHAQLQPRVAAEYEPIQFRNAKNLVLDILRNPNEHQVHARRYAASVIMTITYGKTTPTSYSDPEVQKVNVCLSRLGRAVRPGTYLVDTIPFLRYVPFYLKELKGYHRDELDLFRSQFDVVRNRIANGEQVQPSFARYLIQRQTELEISDNGAAYLAGSMFGAGSDTTASAISVMIMAAAAFPDCQARVQEELDSVVGVDRCPTFEDHLPQVTAFYLECYRWRPVSSTGFVHKATRDIVWNNYVIPAGATVIPSHWSIMRSPDVFKDPDSFNPQRWITADGSIRDDLRNFNFGFGRRVCPGLHVANRSLFINTALTIWAFKISQDPNFPIDTMAFTQSANMSPLPFKVLFAPRVAESDIKRIFSEN